MKSGFEPRKMLCRDKTFCQKVSQLDIKTQLFLRGLSGKVDMEPEEVTKRSQKVA